MILETVLLNVLVGPLLITKLDLAFRGALENTMIQAGSSIPLDFKPTWLVLISVSHPSLPRTAPDNAFISVLNSSTLIQFYEDACLTATLKSENTLTTQPIDVLGFALTYPIPLLITLPILASSHVHWQLESITTVQTHVLPILLLIILQDNANLLVSKILVFLLNLLIITLEDAFNIVPRIYLLMLIRWLSPVFINVLMLRLSVGFHTTVPSQTTQLRLAYGNALPILGPSPTTIPEHASLNAPLIQIIAMAKTQLVNVFKAVLLTTIPRLLITLRLFVWLSVLKTHLLIIARGDAYRHVLLVPLLTILHGDVSINVLQTLLYTVIQPLRPVLLTALITFTEMILLGCANLLVPLFLQFISRINPQENAFWIVSSPTSARNSTILRPLVLVKLIVSWVSTKTWQLIAAKNAKLNVLLAYLNSAVNPV